MKETPSMPSAEVVSSERAERRKLAVIEKNHAVAAAAYQIEQRIVAGEEITSNDLVGLPSSVQARFEQAAMRYSEQKQLVDTFQDAFARLIEDTGSAGNTRDTWGRVAYRLLTHELPEGLVSFQSKEGYFIMSFEDRHDYIQAVNHRQAQVGSVIAEQSSGTYHRALPVQFYDLGEQKVPVIMVRLDPAVASVLERVVTHERQHFINNVVFADFAGAEPESPRALIPVEEDERTHGLRKIKDEALAYLRDGASGTQFRKSMHSELYAHLFGALRPDVGQEAQVLVDRTARFMDDLKHILTTNEARALFTYQLAAVPFEEFPKWLSALEEYYAERMRILRQFDFYYSFDFSEKHRSGSHIDELPSSVFPSLVSAEARAAAETTKGLWFKMYQLYNAVRDDVYDPAVPLTTVRGTTEKLLQEYKGLYEKIEEAYAPLIRGEALLPHGGRSKIIEYAQGASRIGRETAAIREIEQAVVDAASSIPQETIDAFVAEVLSRKSDRRGNDESKKAGESISYMIAETVQQRNGGLSCWLDVSTEALGLPGGRAIRVNYRIASAEKSGTVAEVTFPLYLHSSHSRL